MDITKSDIKRIAHIIMNIRALKNRLPKTSNEILIEIIEFKILFFESELLKFHTDLIACIEDEFNRGLSMEEIIRLYETNKSREERSIEFKSKIISLKCKRAYQNT